MSKREFDTKELRRKLRSDDLIDHVDLHANVKPILAELLDRLEDSEQEKERLLGLAHDQNRELVRLREECRALRTKIEAMERQAPICITTRAHLDAMENGAVRSIVGRDPVFATRGPNDIPLYALPGAKGEEK